MQIVIEEIFQNVVLNIEETVLETTIIISEMQVPSVGEGAVDSVNGKTGFVTLNQDEVPDGTTYKRYSLTEKNKLASITEIFTTALKSSYDSAVSSLSSLLNTGSRLITTGEIAKLTNTSGINTGDQIIPTSLPASDVYPWAKETTKPSYTKAEIGLGNVDNTADADKPISSSATTALGLKVDKVTGERLINASEITKLSNQSGTNTGDQDLSSYATNANLDLKANLVSPTFTGTPTAPTAPAGTNTTQIATTAFVLANAGETVDPSDFALSEGTMLHYPIVATSAGTFSNIGNVCTGTGTAITDKMIGAKITKANGEIGIIATRTSDTSFTTVETFATNSINTAFNLKFLAVKIGSDGSVQMFDSTEGALRQTMNAIGDVNINSFVIQNNGNVTGNGFVIAIQGQVEMLATGAINAKMLTFKQIYTTATLPVFGSGERAVCWVTDALSPTYRGVLVPGGTVQCMVTWDGTNWRT